MRNVKELRAELEKLGVPSCAYSIGSDENESYCLVHESDGWHCYYSERGNRVDEAIFAREQSACEDILRRLLGDGAVRRAME